MTYTYLPLLTYGAPPSVTAVTEKFHGLTYPESEYTWFYSFFKLHECEWRSWMPVQWNQLSSGHFTACLQYIHNPTHNSIPCRSEPLILDCCFVPFHFDIFLATKHFERDFLDQVTLKQTIRLKCNFRSAGLYIQQRLPAAQYQTLADTVWQGSYRQNSKGLRGISWHWQAQKAKFWTQHLRILSCKGLLTSRWCKTPK